MLSVFIEDIEWVTFHQADSEAIYPGVGARCHFSLRTYRDDLFFRAGIPFTAEIARSMPKRRAEYLAGRYLARRVLERLGVERYTLKNGEDRSPQWPDFIVGSLSHNADSALCAAHMRQDTASYVGLDVETVMSEERANSLWPGIINDEEFDWMHEVFPGRFSTLLTLTFSAKESLYKALYPQVKHYFDFLDVKILELDRASHSFTLELLCDLSPDFLRGRRFSGTYQLRDNDVTTFIYHQ
ncbi:4'-phosphopantetheinyl transferase [Lonsdalea quercina]|uniref:4'-phosphopantetheinyl transferase family protein n=1 Tax=Lonsdalea quercina TaxID=71657 RepID=UPI0039761E00